MNILILGNCSDAHAEHLSNALKQGGAAVDYLDTRLFPTKLRMSWQPKAQEGYITLPGERKLNLQDIKSVFWRNFSGVYVPSLTDENQQTIAYNDAVSTVRSLMQACPARWVNSWQAYQVSQRKTPATEQG